MAISGEWLHSALAEEEIALAMAQKLARLADIEDLAALAPGLEKLTEYLAGDLEAHLDREEKDVFPSLAARGLETEVAEASRQHGEIRRKRTELTSVALNDPARVRAVLRSLGTLLAQHVDFEADFLYVDATQSEVEVFRMKVKATCAATHALGRSPATASITGD